MTPLARRTLMLAPLGLFALGGASFYVLLQRMNEGEYDPRQVPSMLLDKKLPNFTLDAQPGQPNFGPADLSALARPALVNFFASWCLPCLNEAAQLLALKRRGIPLYGIAFKDKVDATERFLKNAGNPFAAIGRDEDGRAAMEFGVYGVPETYFIDRSGIVRARWAGEMTDRIISRVLDPLLKQYA